MQSLKSISPFIISHSSYKQQLYDVNGQVSDLTSQLEEVTKLKDAETSQLKIALANSESTVQSLQQEVQSNTTQMATKVQHNIAS